MTPALGLCICHLYLASDSEPYLEPALLCSQNSHTSLPTHLEGRAILHKSDLLFSLGEEAQMPTPPGT